MNLVYFESGSHFKACLQPITSVSHVLLHEFMTIRQIQNRLKVIDSHTAGEPTRCVLGDPTNVLHGSMPERIELLRRDHDFYRRAILCEPRGSEVLVGAYIVEPVDPDCAAAVIFFNNAGYLGMCGHGAIGVAVTLAHLERVSLGTVRLETPVGPVRVELHSSNRATIRNVPSYRYRTSVAVEVPGYGSVSGDVAWGGNWFFLSDHAPCPLTVDQAEPLTAYARAVRRALTAGGVTGAENAEIDHIELYGAAHDPANNGRNFVLCPGDAYDRSPCGTGTSAKLACLAADGLLKPGQIWRQESILGTVFEAQFEWQAHDLEPNESRKTIPNLSQSGKIVPSITGSAFITAENTLIFDPADPFRFGVPE